MIFSQLDQVLAKLFKQQKGIEVDRDKQLSVENTVSLQSQNQVAANAANKINPGYSGYVDIDITGVEYRVFISPYEMKLAQHKKEKQTHYYLLGFKPKAELTSKKLSVSDSVVVLVVLVLVAATALIPLFKLSLVSACNAFSSQDRWWLFSGMVLLVAVLVIGLFNQLFYQQLKTAINQQAQQIFVQIQSSFQHEVRQLQDFALKERKIKNTGQSLSISRSSQIKNLTFDSIVSKDNSYFIESLFALGENGILEGQAKWSTTRLYRNDTIGLGHREYFKRAINNQVWDTPNSRKLKKATDDYYQGGIYLQRLFNLSDGRTTTQFSMPVTITDNTAAVLTFGTKLQSVLGAILPRNFGFLLFENESGKVLYHSNDKRSLIENIYVETDNNAKLRELAWLMDKTNHDNNSVSMRTVYRGEDHLFEVGKAIDGVPWSLVVFYDKAPLGTLNRLSTFTALVLFSVLLAAAYVLVKLLRPVIITPMRQIFWYNAAIADHYGKLAFGVAFISIAINGIFYAIYSGYREHWMTIAVIWLLLWFGLFYGLNWIHLAFNPGASSTDCDRKTPPAGKLFSLYLLVLLAGFVVTPALMLSLDSSGFYLQKYADLEATHLQNSYSKARQTRKDYFNLLLDQKFPNSEEFEKQVNKVPCYLGDSKKPITAGKSYRCNNPGLLRANLWLGEMKKIQQKSTPGWMTGLWRFIALSNPFDSKIWALNQGQRRSADGWPQKEADKGLVIKSNQQRLIMAVLPWLTVCFTLAAGVIWLLLYQFIANRLMGVYIPKNFRLNDHYQQQHRDNKLAMLAERLRIDDKSTTHQGEYVQLIRPRAESVKALLQYPDLATAKPLHIDTLVNSSDSVNISCYSALGVDEHSPAKTVVLEGLELVAMDLQQRGKALAVIEYLVGLGHINIVLLSEIAPLYRLTRQAAYPSKLKTAEMASAAEVTRWAKIFQRFVKLYDWTPTAKAALNGKATAVKCLAYEARGWPEIENIQARFMAYHRAVKDTGLPDNSNKLTAEEQKKVDDSINEFWTDEQVVEFFSANAGAFYRYRWELCTRNERLLLIQMADGGTPNPQNAEPLEHLVRRGYIFEDNGWHIVNSSFLCFIQSAEEPKIVQKWTDDASESSWKYMRIPIFTVLFAVFGIMAYWATEAMESLLAIFTALLGGVSLLVRGLSLTRGNSLPGEE